jgi:hypothetical protein
MSPLHPTRRRFAGLLSAALSLLAAPRLGGAQEAPPSDRGIGGTGAFPPNDREDQGIGGTGVVGTIRRFGSIVVNDMRIGYEPDVRVTVDGRGARVADLRLGQVVRTAALRDGDRLVTRAIAVVSEVIGPVERHRGDVLTVLGQTIDLGDVPHRTAWPRGVRVRVSGLRRPDGSIAASLIERTRDRVDRVAGMLQASDDGKTLRIGRLVLRDVDRALAGQRIVVRGRARRGVLFATAAESETSILRALMSDRLSLEVFLERRGEHLHLGSGMAVDTAVALATLPEHQVVRAVVSATVEDGRVVVKRVDVVDHAGHTSSSSSGEAFGRANMPGGPGDPHGSAMQGFGQGRSPGVGDPGSFGGFGGPGGFGAPGGFGGFGAPGGFGGPGPGGGAAH